MLFSDASNYEVLRELWFGLAKVMLKGCETRVNEK